MTATRRAVDQARQDVLDTVHVLVHGDPNGLGTFWEAVEALEVSYRAYEALASDLNGDVPSSGRHTSVKAAESLPDISSKRGKILRAIVARHQLTRLTDGLTTDEIEVQLSWPHTTVSSAVNALESRGLIRDSGRERPTRAGRARGERGLPVTTAIVYVPTPLAYELLEMRWCNERAG